LKKRIIFSNNSFTRGSTSEAVTTPKTKDGKSDVEETPAQRLGLTDKIFTLKDIIYMR
jgi:hypothetical protein